MKPVIFAMKLPSSLNSDEIRVLLTAADDDAADKFLRHSDMPHAQISLAASVLARIAVSRASGIPASQIKIRRTSHGKPYVKNYSDIYFSISHSRNIIVCAVSERPVGVDIEYIKDSVPMNIANRFYSPEDLSLLNDAAHAEKAKLFFKIWTQRESMVKCTGEGLAAFKKIEKTQFEITSDIVFDNFYMSVCSLTN